MTNSLIAKKEKDDFFNFQHHLCEELSRLKRYSSSIDFLKEQNKKVVDDFFYSNLYMLYQSTFNKNISPTIREDIKYMWDNIKLYHYTGSPALESIIKDKKLKLNSVLKMNDSGEGQALIINILKAFMNEAYCKDKSFNLDDIFTGLSFGNKAEDLLKIVYSFSFTTLKDDASQWARYGRPKEYSTSKNEEPTEIQKNPCGICLEVPMKNLIKLVETINDDFDLAVITPIWYMPNNDIDNTFLKFIKSIINLRLKEENSSEFTKYVTHYSSNIKHESFKKEYEVRLLLSLKHKDSVTNIVVDDAPNYVEFYAKDQYIYLKLAEKLQNFKLTDLFSSITFGPGTSAEAESSVEDLLSKHNLTTLLHADSKHSKCTLR